MTTHRNTALEALMTAHGFTHRTLADEVNRRSQKIFGRPGAATDREVRRWVSGAVRWPTARYLLPLVQIFEQPPEALGFVPRGRSSQLPVPPAAPPVPAAGGSKEDPMMHRRRVLLASTAATVTLVLGLDETPMTGRMTLADVARVNSQVERLHAHFPAVGGGALLDVITSYIDRLRGTLAGCTYGPRVEGELHRVISSLHSSAGWAANDARREDAAALHHAAALQSALLAGDRTGQARAWSNLALQARIEHRDREAVQITQGALTSRTVRRDARMSALLHSRLAIGYARSGDHRAAARALLAAETAYDRFDTAPPAPSWLVFLDASEISGLSAIAHRAMGRLPAAEDATVQALRTLPPARRRNRAYYSVQLSEVQAAQGNTAGAAATLAAVDTSTLSSQRIADRITAVRRTLGPPEDHP
ncbi:hypothetical protein [Streptomyces acidiscabies]|uniref:hypothetical protein n=1 Tax=Streptomyces acidiscabies TaxID=42234 RepID=UPI0038F7073D